MSSPPVSGRLLVAGGLVLCACIIPDRGIRAESDDDNPGAVRIVEAIPVIAELRDACLADPRDPESGFDASACPQVPQAMPQGLVSGGPYCSCPGRDDRTLPEFFIYAEDPDRAREQPADTLYAVALLDLDPLTDSPQNYVAYTEHFTPGGVGEWDADPAGANEVLSPSIGREDNGLWRFRFGKDGGEGVDLCNDDNGRTLAPGLHNLQIMVTDRPFYQPTRLDGNGKQVLDASGQPVLLPPQYGMPDLAIGATWAVANYVFECLDSTVEANGCTCVEDGS